jgi:hypothetical protein
VATFRTEKKEKSKRWPITEAAAVEEDMIEEEIDMVVGHHHPIVVAVGEIVMVQVEEVIGTDTVPLVMEAEVEDMIANMDPLVVVVVVGKGEEEEDRGEAHVLVTVWQVLVTVFPRFAGTFLAYQSLRRIFILSTPRFPSALKEMLKIGDVLLTSLSLVMEFQRYPPLRVTCVETI